MAVGAKLVAHVSVVKIDVLPIANVVAIGAVGAVVSGMGIFFMMAGDAGVGRPFVAFAAMAIGTKEVAVATKQGEKTVYH